MSKRSISKKKNPTPEKGIRNKEKEEEKIRVSIIPLQTQKLPRS
jgi:hypothetical protein